ncbi:membrane protein insertase YidC [Candidatus Omnitrophota bacterium]
MDKRLIFAIALSMLILLSWSRIAPKLYPVAEQPLTGNIVESGRTVERAGGNFPSRDAIQESPVEAEPLADPQLIELERDGMILVFDQGRAAIKEVIFKDYLSHKFDLQRGFQLGLDGVVFQSGAVSSREASFSFSDPVKRITKRFIFSKSKYAIELELTVENLSSGSIIVDLPLTLAELDFSRGRQRMSFKHIAVNTPEATLHFGKPVDKDFQSAKFLAARDRYFCVIVQPEDLDRGAAARIRKHGSSAIASLLLPELTLAPGAERTLNFHIYLGPQELQVISSVNQEWTDVIYFGRLDFIAQILLQLLGFLYGIVHNWGVVILILSVLIYFLLYPLTLKQMRSMKAMQALQPKIAELRNTYKDNPQKLNKATMELYREHKVNPLGGCLPLLFQIPVFFTLYQVLMRSVALKGAHFLWIKDLSEPDRLFTLPTALPVLGDEINILPILMALGMFFQQKITMATSAGGSKEQQKMMMILFPLLFGFIFYRMPSGLVLYWFTNSTFMLINQLRIARAK